jgi:hypothetical protein
MAATDLDERIVRVRDAARRDSSSVWYPVVTDAHIEFVEAALDVELPELLKRCYLEIGNGGFGPGYHLTGLPGGHESSWGDLLQTTEELRRLEDGEESWLPIIDWGCNEFTIVDCDDDQIVTLYEGDFHDEDYSLETLFDRWIEGKVPDLSTGEFRSTEQQ